jgi:hypothetical protein
MRVNIGGEKAEIGTEMGLKISISSVPHSLGNWTSGIKIHTHA